jgi:hypothetical protein
MFLTIQEVNTVFCDEMSDGNEVLDVSVFEHPMPVLYRTIVYPHRCFKVLVQSFHHADP